MMGTDRPTSRAEGTPDNCSLGRCQSGDSSQTTGRLDEPRETVDSVVARLENLIVEQYERGGMTAAAKDAIDRSLDAFSPSRSGTRRLESGEEPEA